MNTDMIAIFTSAALMGAVFVLVQIIHLRRVFLVPEGFAGLLYSKGKLVQVLGVGRHIRWGRFYTWNVLDMRKTSMAVMGQEVLTADNVGIKASLLVTYQVADPAKALTETQNWTGDLYNAAQIDRKSVGRERV